MKEIIALSVAFGLLISCSSQEKKFSVQEIESPANQSAGEPYLFTDPSGNVFLSWIEDQDSLSFLKLSQWQNEKWSEPVTITSGNNWFVNWADYPLAVSDGNGNFMAHILDRSGEGTFAYDVKIVSSTDGVTWGTPRVLHDDGKQAEHGFVSLVPFGVNVFVSWLDGRNTVSDNPEEHSDHGHHGEMSVRAALVDYNGEKIGEWELDKRVCDCCQTTAAITDNGPVVIYRDRSDEEVRDMSIVRFVNGAWTTPKPIYSDNWEINGCPVNGPRSEAIGNTLAIAWFTMANEKPRVNVIFSEDGGETFGKPMQVNDSTSGGRVDLVLLDEQSALVSWMEGPAIKVARVFSNGKKESTTTVSKSSESRSSGFPQLTKSGNTVMMAWTDDKNKVIKTAVIGL